MGKATLRDYDTIVIGSGMGGLTTAALLTRLDNQSVLVLEKHHTPGGFTHSFTRQGRYHWDVGVHYVGGMAQDEVPRKLSDFVSEGRLEWSKLPDPHDVFVYPDETFGVPSNKEAYREKLIAKFPEEEDAIDAYFADVEDAVNWYRRRLLSESLPGPLQWGVEQWNALNDSMALRTTRDYLEDRFDNPRLRSLVTSNWGDYGLLPSESAFAIHALVSWSYYEGAYYPVGGSQQISESILPTIEEHGGECRVNQTVEEILVEDGMAHGVRVRNNETDEVHTIEADTVVSGAGSYNTYCRLLSDDENRRVQDFADELEKFPEGRSFVTAYLGLEESPESLGVDGENYWVNRSWDQNPSTVNPFEILRGEPSLCFLSFGPENDPEADYHTAQAITMAPYRAFEEWSDESWPRKSEEYRDLKSRIGDGLLGLAEEAVPGLGDLVDFREVSTPLSIEHFTAHQHGAPYGVPAVPERYQSGFTGVNTPIDNLYLTGADAGSPGVMGAAFSGLFAAGRAIGGLNGPWQILKLIR